MSSEENNTISDDRHMNDSTLPPPKAKIIRDPNTTNAAALPVRRQKSGVRPGFGMHDWVRLLKTSNDLAQRKGAPMRKISASEVALHNKNHDGWTILHGKVYNIAPYLLYHPGGAPILAKVLGKDGTVLFEKYHRWVNIDGLVGPLLLGYLDVSSPKEEADDLNSRNYLAPQLNKSNDGFTVPRPRPPFKVDVNSMLPPKRDDEEEEEDELLLYTRDRDKCT